MAVNYAETIAYWFFRLNGCLTIPNFIAHPDTKGGKKTDADVLAVRFPYRRELNTFKRKLIDHDFFENSQIRNKVHLIITEVKGGQKNCQFNPSWMDPTKRIFQHILEAIGVWQTDNEVNAIAHNLYDKVLFYDNNYQIQICAIGRRTSSTLSIKYPYAKQLTWANDILPWLHHRLNDERKTDRSTWDDVGRDLGEVAESLTQSRQGFIEHFLRKIGAL
jgi:hypothetical protein